MSFKNTAVAHFRVSTNLSCASGDGLSNEQNRDHFWMFASGPRLRTVRYVIRPTTTPSDAPDLLYEKEEVETGTIAIEPRFGTVRYLIRPTTTPSDAPDPVHEEEAVEISTVATSIVSLSSPVLTSESAVSLEVEYFHPPTEVSSKETIAHVDHSSPPWSNPGRATNSQDFISAYATAFATQRLACHAENGHKTFHPTTQSKRRRLMKMLW
jgi:hypothetical protein